MHLFQLKVTLDIQSKAVVFTSVFFGRDVNSNCLNMKKNFMNENSVVISSQCFDVECFAQPRCFMLSMVVRQEDETDRGFAAALVDDETKLNRDNR